MIHILVEDSTNGLKLCNIIKKIYFDDKFNDIEVHSINGIWFLKDKLEEEVQRLEAGDIILFIYDNICENPLIDQNIEDAAEWLIVSNNFDKVIWIPTNSFELEIMLLYGIEFLCDTENYLKYFWKLRDRFFETDDISDLTKMSKESALYAEMYEKEKKNKKSRRIYSYLSEADFEKAITIETISKRIMGKLYGNASVDRPVNGCWEENCCNRANHCQNKVLDIEKMIEQHNQIDMYKTRWIIENSSYQKIVEKVYEIHNRERTEEDLDIIDMVRDEIISSNCIFKLI